MAQSSTTTRKIATLLISLGTAQSEEILEQLEPNQAAMITNEIAAIGDVPSQTKRAVLREFRALVGGDPQHPEKTIKSAPISDMTQKTAATPSTLLCTLTPQRAADLLADEPAYLVSLLLSGLSADFATCILNQLPDLLQQQVAARLAKPAPRPQELVEQVQRALYAKAIRQTQTEHPEVDEMLIGAQLIAEKPQDNPAHVTQNSTEKPREADTLAFHALCELPHSALHDLLDKLSTPDLCYALRGADRLLADHLLAALPFNRRIAVQSRMKGLGAVPLRTITRIQEQIARLAMEELATPQPAKSRREEVHV